eukprot:c17407_g1_i3.p1 GENE.c17407_g1_i3~~c17407_g1_i3.p1  ORF type:complete len:306 (+),score=32.83 c17407_g1_i3:120-1037(+)
MLDNTWASLDQVYFSGPEKIRKLYKNPLKYCTYSSFNGVIDQSGNNSIFIKDLGTNLSRFFNLLNIKDISDCCVTKVVPIKSERSNPYSNKTIWTIFCAIQLYSQEFSDEEKNNLREKLSSMEYIIADKLKLSNEFIYESQVVAIDELSEEDPSCFYSIENNTYYERKGYTIDKGEITKNLVTINKNFQDRELELYKLIEKDKFFSFEEIKVNLKKNSDEHPWFEFDNKSSFSLVTLKNSDPIRPSKVPKSTVINSILQSNLKSNLNIDNSTNSVDSNEQEENKVLVKAIDSNKEERSQKKKNKC